MPSRLRVFQPAVLLLVLCALMTGCGDSENETAPDPRSPNATRETVITFHHEFLGVLRGAGVRLEAVPPARLERRGGEIRLIMPVAEGRISPGRPGGGLVHDGGLALVEGDTRFELGDWRLNRPRQGIEVDTNGAVLPVFDIAGLLEPQPGPGDRLAGAWAKLNRRGAPLLRDVFRYGGFSPGVRVGDIVVRDR